MVLDSMRIKQKIKVISLALLPVMAFMTVMMAPMAVALNSNCGIDTALISCDNINVNNAQTETSAIWSILLQAINILTAGIGVAALAGIVYGAVLYTTAEGSAEKVKKAIEVIRNVVIGVVAYAFLYSGLNFLIPGGLFT
jgi:hypothetical protein